MAVPPPPKWIWIWGLRQRIFRFIRGTGLKPYKVKVKLTPQTDIIDPLVGVVAEAGKPIEYEVDVRALGPLIAELKTRAWLRSEFPSPRLMDIEVKVSG